MRWPEEKNHKRTKKGTKKTKQKQKKTNILKVSFSVISQSFLFSGGCPKCPFLTTWPKKRAPPKHYKNRGFSLLIFEKTKICATKRPFLDQRNPNPEIPVIILFCLLSSLSTTKNPNICWTPYFYTALANLKKENFKVLNLKHRKLKNAIFAPFFEKRLFFRKLPDNWAHKKTQNDNWAKNRLKPLFL